MNAQCAFECPDLFKMGDWYYLAFSSYADRFQNAVSHEPFFAGAVDCAGNRHL